MDKFVFNASVFEGAPLYASTIATQVTVIDAESSSLASIWSDRDGLSPMANPFTLVEAGVVQFYADEGRYNITAVSGGNISTWNDEILGAAGSGGGVESVVAGDGVLVDSSDSANPAVSSDFSATSTGSSYTLSASNSNNWIDIVGASVVDIECPPESDTDLGSKFAHAITNYGTGVVTVTAGAGVTVIPPPGRTLVIPQFATVGIKKADNTPGTYIVFGPTASV